MINPLCLDLTREEAIANHRKMWKWIVEGTLKRKECVTKEDYFIQHPKFYTPLCLCYCCEYASNNCNECPLKWRSAKCYKKDGEYFE